MTDTEQTIEEQVPEGTPGAGAPGDGHAPPDAGADVGRG